jgi:hypothetical protein
MMSNTPNATVHPADSRAIERTEYSFANSMLSSPVGALAVETAYARLNNAEAIGMRRFFGVLKEVLREGNPPRGSCY